MSYWLGVLGMWFVSDAIYSLCLYLTAEGYNGKRQTWARDHWVRVVRLVAGIAVIAIGATI